MIKNNNIRPQKALLGVLTALLSLISLNLMAKRDVEDPDAVHAAMAILISRHSTAADTIAKEISARFPKSAEMQTALARAYFRNNERQKTRLYLDKAIEANPDYPLSYLLYGDLFGEWQPDSACYWYEKAIAVRPNNFEGYLRWAHIMARTDMEKAIGMLEQLRAAVPTYNVDVEIAALYDSKGDSKNAVAAMQNVDIQLISRNQMAIYLQNLYWANDDERTQEVAKVAMQRFPDNKRFNRVYAWSTMRSGLWQEAVDNGNIWCSSAPHDSINSIDYLTLGVGYMGLGDYDKAFDYLAQMNELKDDYFLPQMPAQIAQAVNKCVNQLEGESRYEEAIDLYHHYIEAYPSTTEPVFQQYQLSQIYRAWQDELNGQEKLDVIRKLFKVYDNIEAQWPEWENIHYVLYTHARWTYSYFDADNEQSLAQPLYLKLWEALQKQGISDEQRKAMAIEACQYLASDAYFQKSNLKEARVWWQRIVELDPDNSAARNALEKIKK